MLVEVILYSVLKRTVRVGSMRRERNTYQRGSDAPFRQHMSCSGNSSLYRRTSGFVSGKEVNLESLQYFEDCLPSTVGVLQCSAARGILLEFQDSPSHLLEREKSDSKTSSLLE